MYKGKGKAVRRFAVDRVIEEMIKVKEKYTMTFVKIGDDLFASKADEWLENFAEQYKQKINLPFNCFLRLDIVNDNILRLLKYAGCFSVHLSVDSTSEYVRQNILRRQMKQTDIIQQMIMIKKYGINTFVNFMLAAPGSTLEDDLDTMVYGKAGKVTYTSYSTTQPMPKTDLYKYCVENNLIPLNYCGDLSRTTSKSDLLCFSKKEKDIRHNILLLGAIIAKMPFPIDKILIYLIKIIPPNILFMKARKIFYNYSMSHRIFKLTR